MFNSKQVTANLQVLNDQEIHSILGFTRFDIFISVHVLTAICRICNM